MPAIIALLIVAFLIRTFLFHPFNIPSESNLPNLVVGDYVFVSKTAYAFGNTPERGDMAIFKLPSDTDIDYMKRVVGLPGDHIQMIQGVLNINGAPVKLQPITLAPKFYEETGIKFFRETLSGGRSYVIANMVDDGTADNTIEYIVPAGHYFALGDNRDNSEDSRFLDAVGYIPEENFVGPVVIHFWNSRGFGLANRPEEIYP